MSKWQVIWTDVANDGDPNRPRMVDFAATVTRQVAEESQRRSSYAWCACRDCLNTVVRGEEPTLCDDCEGAGCLNYERDEPGFNYECQRDDWRDDWGEYL